MAAFRIERAQGPALIIHNVTSTIVFYKQGRRSDETDYSWRFLLLLCQLVLDVDIVLQPNLILRIAESIVAGYGYQNDVDEISPPRSPPGWKNGDGQLSRAVRIRIGGIHYLYDNRAIDEKHILLWEQIVQVI